MAGTDHPRTNVANDNWVKGVLVMRIADEAVRPFVTDEINKFHKVFKSEIRHGSLCGQCISTNAKGCQSGICSDVTSYIESFHRYKLPCYENSNIAQWLSDPWEIAKCYMSRSRDLKGKPGSEIDFLSIINVVINNTHFKNQITAGTTNKRNIFCQGRDARNETMHSRHFETTEHELKQHCDIFIEIVKLVARDSKTCKTFVERIEKVRDGPLTITTDDIDNLREQAARYQGLAEPILTSIKVETKTDRRKEFEGDKELLELTRRVSILEQQHHEQDTVGPKSCDTSRHEDIRDEGVSLGTARRYGTVGKALSKLRDTYRKYLGNNKLEFDIILKKEEVIRLRNEIWDDLNIRVKRLEEKPTDVNGLHSQLVREDASPLQEVMHSGEQSQREGADIKLIVDCSERVLKRRRTQSQDSFCFVLVIRGRDLLQLKIVKQQYRVEIKNLHSLCKRKGVADKEIQSCAANPGARRRRSSLLPVLNRLASLGLSVNSTTDLTKASFEPPTPHDSDDDELDATYIPALSCTRLSSLDSTDDFNNVGVGRTVSNSTCSTMPVTPRMSVNSIGEDNPVFEEICENPKGAAEVDLSNTKL